MAELLAEGERVLVMAGPQALAAPSPKRSLKSGRGGNIETL